MARLEDKFKARASGQTPDVTPTPFGAKTEMLTDLPVSQIRPDPNQPRKDLGDLAELKASIASVGIVQPILVRVIGYEAYEIIAGERRFTAARELGMERVPAIVRTLEEHHRLELQIIENLHRKDLNPLEEAESYRRLMEEFKVRQEDLGKRLGRSQSSISETLKLLALPNDIKEEYRTSDIGSKSLLLEIARQPTDEGKRQLWNQALRGELTVKKARLQKSSVKSKSNRVSPSTEMNFRYPIQTDRALVTLTFEQPRATLEDIILALEQALAGERARQDPHSSSVGKLPDPKKNANAVIE